MSKHKVLVARDKLIRRWKGGRILLGSAVGGETDRESRTRDHLLVAVARHATLCLSLPVSWNGVNAREDNQEPAKKDVLLSA